LLAWGNDRAGQLFSSLPFGDIEKEKGYVLRPFEIITSKTSRPMTVAAGWKHSLVCLSTYGVLGVGANGSGQLGLRLPFVHFQILVQNEKVPSLSCCSHRKREGHIT